jgi:non-canonical purine NTP pyrophosphatase (RdgB/HAM1 family)
MKKNAYFITGNKGKLAEIERILGFPVKHIELDLDELQEMDERKIVEHKVRQAWEKIEKPVIVWDGSVYLSCLNGFPGPLIKWFWQTVSLEKVCKLAALMKDNKVKAKTTLAFFDGENIQYFEAEEWGTIPNSPRGEGGFGWDSIFVPDGSQKTFAEMESDNPLLHLFNNQVFTQLNHYLQEKGFQIRT